MKSAIEGTLLKGKNFISCEVGKMSQDKENLNDFNYRSK